MSVLFFIIPSVLIILSAFIAVKAVKRGVSKKKAVICQICSAALIMGFSFFLAAKPVFAAETPESSAQTETSAQTTQNSSQEGTSAKAMAFAIGLVAAALVTGLSGIGGGIAVAASAPAAIAATSENPKAFGKSLILVVLGEGIALYGLLISILIFGQLEKLAM